MDDDNTVTLTKIQSANTIAKVQFSVAVDGVEEVVKPSIHDGVHVFFYFVMMENQ
jgi:hypothetical protein